MAAIRTDNCCNWCVEEASRNKGGEEKSTIVGLFIKVLYSKIHSSPFKITFMMVPNNDGTFFVRIYCLFLMQSEYKDKSLQEQLLPLCFSHPWVPFLSCGITVKIV